jgi:methionyl-tRNA synthetase
MFYVTTPIYYVNARPHIGHAYTTILADVLRRFHRLFGEETYFLTGVDEHGQKVEEAAAKRGMTPQQHCDDMERHFRDAWPGLHIATDDFIRTTEARHKRVVQEVLQQLWDAGEIYRDEYEGWYSPSVERYWTEKDLVDGKCPESGQPVQFIKEANYFFRMGKYQQRLVDHIESHPDFIRPESRRNEVLGFLKKPLKDLCISRPKARLSWGIEIPFDRDYVTYVWFDALLNYVTAAFYETDKQRFAHQWAGVHHLIGKDILTTHSVYWPTMLMGAGLPLPKSIIATGWWLVDNTKMSKSLGNVVSPLELKDKYGVDVMRYFLMREMSIGQDANFSEAALVARNNSDLANDLGNLTNRVAHMVGKYSAGVIQPLADLQPVDVVVRNEVFKLKTGVPILVNAFKLNVAIEEILQFVRSLNKYIDVTKPFTTAKTDPARCGTSLRVALEGIRVAANLLHPVMPVKMEEILRVSGAGGPVETLDALEFGGIREGAMVQLGEPVFPRHEFVAPIEIPPAVVPTAPAAAAPVAAPAQPASDDGLIDFETFAKIDLRVAEVLTAEAVQGADKLLKLRIRVGAEERDLVAGIRAAYSPESMVGRKIVIVANLKPRKLRGVMSQGMLLAAHQDDGAPVILMPSADVPSGSKVS